MVFLLFYISFNCADQHWMKCIWKASSEAEKYILFSMCGIQKHKNKKTNYIYITDLYFAAINCTKSHVVEH